MIVLCTEQRVPEWYAARLGKLTGSVAGDMLARIKTGEAAARPLKARAHLLVTVPLYIKWDPEVSR